MGNEMMRRLARLILAVIFSVQIVQTEELPENEIQVLINSYMDNFRVNILYPALSITKRITRSTNLNGRYLVDCITAASMRSRFKIDGITSATSNTDIDALSAASRRKGHPESTFDEVRHELNIGLLQLIGDGSLSLNGLYSIEHDYRSWTLAAQLSYPFAMKNTTIQLGFVKSWDQVFPDTRTWMRRKDVITASAGLTQLLTPMWIIQLNASITSMTGFLSDPYQPVPIFNDNTFIYHETVLPSHRLRKAASIRSNWMLSQNTSLQLGYRYYWDDWQVDSHTANFMVQCDFAEKLVTLSLGMRHYIQNQADFYNVAYTSDSGFLTVDSKLKDLWSNEVELGMNVKGTIFQPGHFLYSDRIDYYLNCGFYQRKTATPDWFSGYTTLYAYTISFGFKYKF